MQTIVNYLTHYYKKGTSPFRTLSALAEQEALAIMEALCDETAFGMRFKNPAQYLKERRQTEQWVHQKFIEKGGRPQADYPVYMVLGDSAWIRQAAGLEPAAEIHIPLDAFEEWDVSFTYPDSMISLWLASDQPPEYYLPDYHGKVYTRCEMLALVAIRGLPEVSWKSNLPPGLAPYIEAQVWNHNLLLDYQKDG
jgi:hypothetical protein